MYSDRSATLMAVPFDPAAGYSSLYLYCREVLKLTEFEAYLRIEVARLARRFPLILTRLAEGSLHLTTVRLLAPQLRPDNYQELLDEASGKSKREVKLQRARDLLSHTIRDRDPGEVVDRALTLLIKDLERKKTGTTDRPRRSRGTKPGSRYIPAEVKR